MDNLSIATFYMEKIPSVGTKEKKLLKQKTDEFEAIILKLLLDMAIKSNDTLLPEDPGRKIYHSMQNEQFGKELSGNFGFSELLFRYLSEENSAKA